MTRTTTTTAAGASATVPLLSASLSSASLPSHLLTSSSTPTPDHEQPNGDRSRFMGSFHEDTNSSIGSFQSDTIVAGSSSCSLSSSVMDAMSSSAVAASPPVKLDNSSLSSFSLDSFNVQQNGGGDMGLQDQQYNPHVLQECSGFGEDQEVVSISLEDVMQLAPPMHFESNPQQQLQQPQQQQPQQHQQQQQLKHPGHFTF